MRVFQQSFLATDRYMLKGGVYDREMGVKKSNCHSFLETMYDVNVSVVYYIAWCILRISSIV